MLEALLVFPPSYDKGSKLMAERHIYRPGMGYIVQISDDGVPLKLGDVVVPPRPAEEMDWDPNTGAWVVDPARLQEKQTREARIKDRAANLVTARAKLQALGLTVNEVNELLKT